MAESAVRIALKEPSPILPSDIHEFPLLAGDAIKMLYGTFPLTEGAQCWQKEQRRSGELGDDDYSTWQVGRLFGMMMGGIGQREKGLVDQAWQRLPLNPMPHPKLPDRSPWFCATK